MSKILLTLLILILPAFSILLQPGYFPIHDDLQTVRQLEMAKCFADGQFPCRWVSDLGYGFGYPLFNFYPPLPYLIGHPFHLLGLAYIDIVKVIGIAGFVFTAFAMYLLGREFWGRSGGLLASLVYTYAPYHSVDFYVRGAVNEFWAMAFFPAIFYCSYKLIQKISENNNSSPRLRADSRGVVKWITLLSLSVSGLMLSHNLMLLIFAPVLVIWCLFWIISLKALSALKALFLSAFWSFGLAAFFTLPVIFESQFAHVETLTIGYFNFLAHFLDLNQIFLKINWGYGESVYGSADTMSFAVGFIQWLLPALVILAAVFNKNLKKNISLLFLFAVLFLLSLFMSHYKATPIWLKLRPLQFLQFPWRFLTLAVFCASFLSGAFAKVLGSRTSKPILLCSLALTLLLNANFFHPREWYPAMTDDQKFSGKSWIWQVTGSIFDYLPIWAPLPPRDPAGGDLGITAGTGTYSRITKRTNFQEYVVMVTSRSAIVELQTFYFPGWRIYLDGREVAIDPARDPLLGRMQIDVSIGTHTLTARFTDTPIRTLGNVLSLISWAVVILTGGFYLKPLSLRVSSHL